MRSLYERILKEGYDRTGEILDILQVFFMQAMSTGIFTISTNQIIKFIKDRLNITLDYEELREALNDIAVVEAVDEEKISLYDPESMEAMESENNIPETTSEEDEEAEEAEKQKEDMIKTATETATNDLEKASELQ